MIRDAILTRRCLPRPPKLVQQRHAEPNHEDVDDGDGQQVLPAEEAEPLEQMIVMIIVSIVITTVNDMTTLAAGEAKRHFGRMIDTSQREPVTIEKHGRPVAVVVSKHEYDKIQEQLAEARAWKETGYLLSTEANREALMEAIAQLNDS